MMETYERFLLGMGLVLILVGLVLPSVGFPLPSLAIVIVDTAAPEFVNTAPSNGLTYSSLTTVSAQIRDSVSGVNVVYFYLDGSMSGTQLTLTSGTIYDGVWSAQISNPSAGSHTFKFSASDFAANLIYKTGSFSIYADLQGDWYLNDVKVTSPDQTIYLRTTTLTFKFVKTAGTASIGQITCKVTYSGPESDSAYLAYYQDLGCWMWTKPSAWTQGRYSMTLEASDGKKTITLSIFQVEIGGSPTLPPWQKYVNIPTVSGLALVLVGCASYGIRRAKES